MLGAHGAASDASASVDCAPVRPRVFVYDLPREFRDKGLYDCPTRDCAYGGPPKLIRDIEQWSSGQYNLPWMLWDRVKTSPSRTTNVNEADIFFVPAWARSKRDCIPPARLWEALTAQNPRLLTEGRKLAVRHLLVDLHNTLVCSFMMDAVSEPAKWFTRVCHTRIAPMLETRADRPRLSCRPILRWTSHRGTWLSIGARGSMSRRTTASTSSSAQRSLGTGTPSHFPQRTMASRHRARPGRARVGMRATCGRTWSATTARLCNCATPLPRSVGRRNAASAGMRRLSRTTSSPKACPRAVASPTASTTVSSLSCTWTPHSAHRRVQHSSNQRALAPMPTAPSPWQPMGDSATRKGIVDSIVFGCIPIVFVHRQTTLWRAHMSREEFLSFAVFVPEAYVIGDGANGMSVYGKADVKEGLVKGVHPPGGSLEAILAAMPPAELHRRQAAMAAVAPRMLLAIEDGGCDALDSLFRRMLHHARRLEPSQGLGRTQRGVPAQPPQSQVATAPPPEGRDAVVILSSSTMRKYFVQHVASVASVLFFNPGLDVHVHTAYDPELMLAELQKLPFAQAAGGRALQRLQFHALSPRPAGLSEAKRLYRKWKLELLQQLPARRSLYLDGDVIACKNLEPTFTLLDQFDLVCAHSHLPHSQLPKFSASTFFREANVPDAFTGCNGGVLGARNGSAAHVHVLQRWADCVRDGRERYDMPCLAGLMWRNPSKNYYVLPPQFNVRPSVGMPGGAVSDPSLIHTLYGADTLAQQMASVANGTCLSRLREAGIVTAKVAVKPRRELRAALMRPAQPRRLAASNVMVADSEASKCPVKVADAQDFAAQVARAQLFFVHIPKCGGTTISEILPQEAQVLKSKPPSSEGAAQLRQWQQQWRTKSGSARGMPSPWHLPPDLYERVLSDPFPARNRRVICVVRDPAERYRSEGAYRVKQHHRSLPFLSSREATTVAAELQRGRQHFRLSERTLHLAPQSWFVWTDAGNPQCHCVVAIEKLVMLNTENTAVRSGHRHRLNATELPEELQALYADDKRLWERAKAAPSFSLPVPPRDLMASVDPARAGGTAPPSVGCLSRTIWMLWEQGWDTAPPVARLCRDAAIQLNGATWNVVLLNRSSIAHWVDEPLITAAYKIKSTNPSDLIRFFLLSKYGGVWLDATIFGVKPLDEWLPSLLTAETSTGWLEWDDDSPRPSINFIAACSEGTLGAAAAHVVALARAGKIRDNSYHCFNREFAGKLRAHERTLRSRQLGASSNGRKEGHKLMSNSGAALGRVLDARSNWTLHTFPYFKLTHKYKDLRIGALSALYAAAMLVWRDKEAARAHLHGIGTWHEGPLSAPKVVVTAKGRKSLLQGY